MDKIFLTIDKSKFVQEEVYSDGQVLLELFRSAYSYGGYELEDFVYKFFKSRFRVLLEQRQAMLLYGPPDRLWKYFLKENDVKKGGFQYSSEIIYWVATTYAMMYGATGIPLATVIDVLPVKHMINYYTIGHQMGFESFIRRVNSDLTDYYAKGGTLPVVVK